MLEQSLWLPAESWLDVPEHESSIVGRHKKPDEEAAEKKEKEEAEKAEKKKPKKKPHKKKDLEPEPETEEEASETESEETNSEYEEPDEDSLIEMMKTLPLEDVKDGWDQDMPILVLPLSLSLYMDTFWADSAPYYLPALLANEKDKVINWTTWTDPDDDDKESFGKDVLTTRKIEKKLHTSVTSRMCSANTIQHIAILDNTDTAVTIMVKQTAVGSPYVADYNEWFKWEVITPDERSNQVVVRQQAAIKWIEEYKPWVVWRTVEKWSLAAIKDDNERIEKFLHESAEKVAKGGYLSDQTLPKRRPVPSEAIRDGYTSVNWQYDYETGEMVNKSSRKYNKNHKNKKHKSDESDPDASEKSGMWGN